MYTGSLFDTFEKLFYDSFANLPRDRRPFLPYNIYRKDNSDEIFIELSVAGYPKESLSVEEREGYIHISGKVAEEDSEVKYLHKGLTSKNFEFSIPFNLNYTIENVELEDGILRISITRPAPAVRQLEITTKKAA